MRTIQQRRMQLQHSAWLGAQNPNEFTAIRNDGTNPYRAAGFHTEVLFQAMWKAADVMTTRQIEAWHDPRARFMTCDAPVLVPFVGNVRPDLLSTRYVIWPVSPQRAVALSDELQGEKAVFREATGKMVGLVRRGVEQGRERMILASEDQHGELALGKAFRRRVQVRLRCSDRGPGGEYVPPPGCCVQNSEVFSTEPDVLLCNQGLYSPAPEMWSHN
jgi:hypothetical protein